MSLPSLYGGARKSRAFGAVSPGANPFAAPRASGYAVNNNGGDPRQFTYEYNAQKPDNWGALGFQTFPWLQQQLDYGMSLEPARQSAINHLLQSLSPGNVQSQVDVYRRHQQAAAQDQARQTALQLQAAGYGQNAVTSAQLAAANQAAQATNKYDAMLNSPEGRAQALQAVLAAIGTGQSMPALGPASQLFQNSLAGQDFRRQGEEWQTQMDQQGGLGSLLGGLAGMALSGQMPGLGSLFGKKGKSGSAAGAAGPSVSRFDESMPVPHTYELGSQAPSDYWGENGGFRSPYGTEFSYTSGYSPF